MNNWPNSIGRIRRRRARRQRPLSRGARKMSFDLRRIAPNRAHAKDGAIMKVENNVLSRWISFAVLLLLAGAFARANAQTTTPPQGQTDPAQMRGNQVNPAPNQGPDLAQLNL